MSRGERVFLQGAAVCESGRDIRMIVARMVADGLKVDVNGQDMTGFKVR